jgi:hypothetical protein
LEFSVEGEFERSSVPLRLEAIELQKRETRPVAMNTGRAEQPMQRTDSSPQLTYVNGRTILSIAAGFISIFRYKDGKKWRRANVSIYGGEQTLNWPNHVSMHICSINYE